MKKISLIIFMSFALVLSINAAVDGEIGLSLEYMRYYDSSFSKVTSNELVLSAKGRNTFDDDEMFGISYSLGYGFPFNEMRAFKNIHMSANAIFDFKSSAFLTLSLYAGLHNSIYLFRNASSDQLAAEAGASLLFTPLSYLLIELSMGYAMPLISFYGNSVSFIALDSHIIKYALTVSYSY